MYALIETGGKQYRVAPGEQFNVELLEGDVGGQIQFDRVLMIGKDQDFTVGHPYLDSAKVLGEIVAQDRAKKILVFKKKRRKNYRRTQGHRQWFTRIKILSIEQ